MDKLKTHYFKNIRFQLLDLDTNLFGFKVARILNSKLSIKELRSILDKLKLLDIRLVYWQADGIDTKSKNAALKLNGFLGSLQTTYLIDLKKINPSPKKDREVKIYQTKTPTTEMKKLSVQIGNLSRFGKDPKMPNKSMQKLYHLWIKNSTNGDIAEKVLVTKNKNKITSMITLGTKKKRGDIGLLAVSKSHQGKKLGTKLVRASQKYFLDKGFSKLQVVTQKENSAACHLYEKCGFYIEKIDNFFHFWL